MDTTKDLATVNFDALDQIAGLEDAPEEQNGENQPLHCFERIAYCVLCRSPPPQLKWIISSNLLTACNTSEVTKIALRVIKETIWGNGNFPKRHVNLVQVNLGFSKMMEMI